MPAMIRTNAANTAANFHGPEENFEALWVEERNASLTGGRVTGCFSFSTSTSTFGVTISSFLAIASESFA